METKLLQLFQRLGMGDATGVVYAVVLRTGPLTISQIVGSTGLPSAEVNTALRMLSLLQVVSTDQRRGRRLFYATDPRFAWLSLTADLVWRSTATLKPVRSLPSTGRENIENLRKLYAEISEVAQRLYKPQSSATEHKERDVETEEEFAQLTCEIIYQSRNQIRAVARSPLLPQLSAFWTALTDQIGAGVSYTRIADLQEVIDHGLLIKRRDMHEYGIDLRIIEASRVSQSFFIVDNKFLSTSHNLDLNLETRRRGVGRVTSSRIIIDRYKRRFNQYLSQSIPGRFVVEAMQRAADPLLERASQVFLPDESAWLQSVIDWGVFSRFHVEEGWSRARIELVEQKALSAQLVRRNHAGFVIPHYPLGEAEIRAAFEESGGDLDAER